MIYAQIYVLRRALDGEIFFASGGAARRGAREGLFCRCRLEVLHLFENVTPNKTPRQKSRGPWSTPRGSYIL